MIRSVQMLPNKYRITTVSAGYRYFLALFPAEIYRKTSVSAGYGIKGLSVAQNVPRQSIRTNNINSCNLAKLIHQGWEEAVWVSVGEPFLSSF